MEKQKITFVSNIPYISKIEECVPKPMQKTIPDWWKKTVIGEPSIAEHDIDFGNIKNCPSFPDYFSQGYVVPMWTDTIIDFDKKTGDWFWKTPSSDFHWEIHPPTQFVDTAQPLVRGDSGYAVFKAVSPWSMITPLGYSVLQLPMFYNFNKDFTVLPGIFASDVEHTLNIQILLHSDKKQIVIERGTPIAQYIPFKRNDTLSMEYREATEEDKEKIAISDMYYKTKLFRNKEYIKRKKETDKQNLDLEQ
jgi:hypothetical protein